MYIPRSSMTDHLINVDNVWGNGLTWGLCWHNDHREKESRQGPGTQGKEKNKNMTLSVII